jgi:hypothetical protein
MSKHKRQNERRNREDGGGDGGVESGGASDLAEADVVEGDSWGACSRCGEWNVLHEDGDGNALWKCIKVLKAQLAAARLVQPLCPPPYAPLPYYPPYVGPPYPSGVQQWPNTTHPGPGLPWPGNQTICHGETVGKV